MTHPGICKLEGNPFIWIVSGVILAAMAAFLMVFSTRACAQSAEEAQQTLQAAVTRILNDIKNPDFSNPATRGSVRARIEREVKSVFDFEGFSQRTVGPRWREFTPDQKTRFSNAFADLLFNTYLNKINGYNGEQVNYTGIMASKDGKLVEVRTEITMRSGKKTPVFYRMSYKNGQWRVYDVIIENISLVNNYRSQFKDILNTDTPDQLIAQVEAKVREIQAQGATDEKK